MGDFPEGSPGSMRRKTRGMFLGNPDSSAYKSLQVRSRK